MKAMFVREKTLCNYLNTYYRGPELVIKNSL